ncbi:MAG: ABC transporter ATP-binding protein [Clostridia bacterium]
MDYIIKTKDIKRAFPIAGGDEFYALKGISLKIQTGKLSILKGRSGSGKTTLMNILAALDQATSGEISFDDVDLTKLSDEKCGQLRRNHIGFIFQSVALIPIMTAYENVEFALRLAKYKGDMKKRVTECLTMVGLGSRMNHMPQELSGGEQQRVAIARAIVHEPKVLFADEPTAELDTLTSLQVMKIFKDLCQNHGITVVMTTHDTELMDIGDEVFELEDGEIVNG